MVGMKEIEKVELREYYEWLWFEEVWRVDLSGIDREEEKLRERRRRRNVNVMVIVV